jgi:thiol-disulfide isomerase/thioredoxin
VSTGLWVLVVALGVATLFGLWRGATDGRLRGTRSLVEELENAPLVEALVTPWADQLGERATLVQFSSAFCAPCRTTRKVLASVAEAVPGVNHVEIDAEHHLELVRRLGIFRTPTTLILDPDGVERLRASGIPKRDQVIGAL